MPAKTIEMVVSLKVPDTTAITALQTLQNIGFKKIVNVFRSDYYKFLIDSDENQLKNKISKVDILVNANKHACSFSIDKKNGISILVKNINDDGSGLLSTLNNRLGFKNINKAEKAVLWGLSIDAEGKEAMKIAEKAAKELLVNENYQEFVIL